MTRELGKHELLIPCLFNFINCSIAIELSIKSSYLWTCVRVAFKVDVFLHKIYVKKIFIFQSLLTIVNSHKCEFQVETGDEIGELFTPLKLESNWSAAYTCEVITLVELECNCANQKWEMKSESSSQKFKLKVEMESEKYNQTKIDNSKDLEKVEMKLEKYNQTKKEKKTAQSF